MKVEGWRRKSTPPPASAEQFSSLLKCHVICVIWPEKLRATGARIRKKPASSAATTKISHLATVLKSAVAEEKTGPVHVPGPPPPFQSGVPCRWPLGPRRRHHRSAKSGRTKPDRPC